MYSRVRAFAVTTALFWLRSAIGGKCLCFPTQCNGLAVLLLAQMFTGNAFTPEVIALAVLNAVIVAFAAMGVYERAIALPEAEKNDELVEAAHLLGSDGFGVAYAQTEESTPGEKGEEEDAV